MQPKRSRLIMTALLATGLAPLGYAQLPLRVSAHPFNALIAAQEPQQDEQKPKEKPDAKASKTDKQDKAGNPDKTDKQEKPAAQQPKPANTQKRQDVARQDQKQDLTKQGQKADRSQTGSRRVSDSDLKAHFGQQHKFNVRQVVTTTTIVPNQTQFVYTGYTFVFADAWPAGWAMGDDCYIDYIDGQYFLIDVVHPGVRVALTIVG